jgi:5-(carboxyamino)imidazole ribonucleotide mutase
MSSPRSKRTSRKPLVGIIMGSSSDADIMKPARDILTEFGVPCEFKVVSAHRTPDEMFRYAETAQQRGIEVIIAGAGGSAHLPGMVASKTTLPVIGVPVKTRSLDGLDSLLSIIQMPAGIPVATIAINNATNAGLLAVRILAIAHPALRKRLEQHQKSLKKKVLRMKLK